MTKRTLRFLIISGLPIFAVGLEEVISRNFKARVHRVEKARDGLDLCAIKTFDLVLLGVTQPERSGLNLLPDFQKRGPNCRVLIVSLLAEERILDGGKYISQAFAGRFAESLDGTKEKLHESLSPREFEVFLRIARGGTVKEIGGQLSLSAKTISTYHTHILQKLNIRNDAELGEYALRNGLVA